MPNDSLREILLDLVSELEDLRANQVVLGRAEGARLTIAEAREAKSAAIGEHQEFFRKLRKQIEDMT